jgi:hypothetical protein
MSEYQGKGHCTHSVVVIFIARPDLSKIIRTTWH